jgi:CDP-diglyceride synthetase
MLKQRTLTALILAPLAIAIILFLPTYAVALIISALCLVAVWEWARLAGIESPVVRALAVAFNAGLFVVLWSIREEPLSWFVIVVGLLWWLLSLLWMRSFSYAAAPTRENAAIKLIACELSILPSWLALMKLHGGTDHGHGNVMWLLGGPVAGGKVHGDWPGLDDAALHEGRDLAITTDFRQVLAGIAEKHLRLPDARLGQVFPGWSGTAASVLRG